MYTSRMCPNALTVSLLAIAFAACATSQPSPAPQPETGAIGANVASPAVAVTPKPVACASVAPAPPPAAPPEVDAKYRACAYRAECVAVEPVGCCHTGRVVAVATEQKEAYLASFVCADRRPICPLIRLLPDGRVPACDRGLCILTNR
jgi:hypothetical protein